MSTEPWSIGGFSLRLVDGVGLGPVLADALPAPPGYWVSASRCLVYRRACERYANGQPVDALCEGNREKCSTLTEVDDGACTDPLQHQPCDWRATPQLLGKWVQALPQSALDDDFPYPCAAGLLGSTGDDQGLGQRSSFCGGRSPAGTYQPLEAGLTLLACRRGSYCPRGVADPLPCRSGTYSNWTNLESAGECITAEPGYFAPLGSISQQSCRSDTYNPLAGSSSDLDCLPCPGNSTTDGQTGQRFRTDCQCTYG